MRADFSSWKGLPQHNGGLALGDPEAGPNLVLNIVARKKTI